MSDSDSIISILNAVDELNSKQKNALKKSINKPQNDIKKNNIANSEIPPFTDKLIKEAEVYKSRNLIKDNPHYETLEKAVLTDQNYELHFYKEHHEKLIIENNDLKIRLANAKQQLASFESNKLDLKSALDHLNKVLSRSSVIDTLNTINKSKVSDKEENSQTVKKD